MRQIMKFEVLNNLIPVGTMQVLFNVSASTLRRWRQEEELPYRMVVGNENPIILYDFQSVVQWADAHSVGLRIDAARAYHSERSKKWEALSKL